MEVRAPNYKTIKRDFDPVEPGSSLDWQVNFELDGAALAQAAADDAQKKFQSQEASLVATLDDYLVGLRHGESDRGLSSAAYNDGIAWTEKIEKEDADVLRKSDLAAGKLADIKAVLEKYKPKGQAPVAPSVF